MTELMLPILMGLGAVLTLLGYFFPGLNRLLPSQIDRFWFMVRLDDWSSLASASVRRFIRLTERLSNITAGGARSLFLTAPIVLLSVWGAAQISGPREAAGDWITHLPAFLRASARPELLLAAAGAFIILFGIKVSQGPIQHLVRISQVRRRLIAATGERRRLEMAIERAERELGASEDTDEEEKDFMEGRLRWLKRRHEDLSDEIDRMQAYLKNNSLVKAKDRGQGSIFIVFLLSLAGLLLYSWLVLREVGPRVFDALFASGPIQGFIAVAYFMLPVTVIFIFLQSVVPSFITLLNPRRLTVRIREDASDPLGQGGTFLFLFGASLSLFLTYGAFLVGHIIEPDGYVPQTLQMILSNALFDGLTFAVTLYIMRLMERFSGWLSLLVLVLLILVDIAIAAIFASASLYFGLLGTPAELSLLEVGRVLIALHPEQSEIHLGPLFWVMHTAFIPTAIYLTFILFWGLAKLVMSLVLLVTRQAASRGLMATGGMLGALAALLEAALLGVQGYVQ